MSLTSLWKSDKGELAAKSLQAVVKWAGDGKLLDGGKTSSEFREFLTNVSSSMLARYASECLGDEKFAEGCSALQDVINEVGRRLGFEVRNGLYRGKSTEIGNDGLWLSKNGSAIILEVKTTAAYMMDLDTLANYRKKLTAENKIGFEKSSILIVVGRSEKTDSLEAQIRGSRHAWDIRMISVDALLRLVRVKEELEDPKVVDKIRQILTPKEFTKVDEIIDLVFSTTEDVKKEETIQDEISGDEGGKHSTPVDFRESCLVRLQKHLGVVLVKRSAALYSTADEKIGLVCLNSRTYEMSGQMGYWFGFRLLQKEAIEKYKTGLVVFGCGSPQRIIAVPAKQFLNWLPNLNVTDNGDAFYWHVHMREKGNRYVLKTKEGGESQDLTQYLLPSK
jgi:hypothetical protein